MDERTALLVGLLAVAGAATVGVAAAHGNHATAGPQVSANGTVVVEQVFLSEPGYVVLTVADGAGRDRIVGHRPLDPGLHHGVRARVDPDRWRTAPDTVVVDVWLYGDDGDGEFDPDADPRLLRFDRPAGATVPVRKGPAPVGIVTDGTAELAPDGTLAVESVTLAERGHVVVHAPGNGSLGEALGHRTLDPGRHANVSVPAGDPPAENRAVVVAVHRDDGDGEFDPAADPPVRVDGAPVASDVTVLAGGRDPVRVNTPTPAAAESGDATTPGTPDRGATTGADATATGRTGGDGVGFGIPVALASLLVALLAGRWLR